MSGKKTLGFGLFGMGWVAEEHIKGYMNSPRCESKALASRKRESSQAKKDVFGLDCNVLDTYDDQFLCTKSLINKGGLGDVYFIETDYWHDLGPSWWNAWGWGPYTKKGGGAASLISGCHAIGAMMSIGGDVEEIFCYETRSHRKDFEYAPTYAAVVKF